MIYKKEGKTDAKTENLKKAVLAFFSRARSCIGFFSKARKLLQ